MTRLYRHLLSDYEREVRPAIRYDHVILMDIDCSVEDERNQILTTSAWVRQNWFDYKLVWDPRMFGNLRKIHIPHEKIWLPDVILYNNALSSYAIYLFCNSLDHTSLPLRLSKPSVQEMLRQRVDVILKTYVHHCTSSA
ncbi:unnamed protein product [Strongylus vulgaris]|uniref:Neurotransmitter-gated ion-channel ligand-binding domain-containing protein n=1 Tax=Strongylus vulgaris TaxID=40348 RepID=A0A3P7JVZ1_STRVU|nr:unnamed protein product [Strongylus vulgaris]